MLDLTLKTIIRLKKHSLAQVGMFTLIPIFIVALLALHDLTIDSMTNEILQAPLPQDYSIQITNTRRDTGNQLNRIMDLMTAGQEFIRWLSTDLVGEAFYHATVDSVGFARLCQEGIINDTSSCADVNVLILPASFFLDGRSFYFYMINQTDWINAFSLYFRHVRTNDSFVGYTRALNITSNDLLLEDRAWYLTEVQFMQLENATVLLSFPLARSLFRTEVLSQTPEFVYRQYQAAGTFRGQINYNQSYLHELRSIHKIFQVIDNFETNIESSVSLSSITGSTIRFETRSPFKSKIEDGMVIQYNFTSMYFLITIPLWLPSFFLVLLIQYQNVRPLYDFLKKLRRQGIDDADVIDVLAARFALLDLIGIMATFTVVLPVMTTVMSITLTIDRVLIIVAVSLAINVVIQFVANLQELSAILGEFQNEESNEPLRYQFSFTRPILKLSALASMVPLVAIVFLAAYSSEQLRDVAILLLSSAVALLLLMTMIFGSLHGIMRLLRVLLAKQLTLFYLFKGDEQFRKKVRLLSHFKELVIVLLLMTVILSLAVDFDHSYNRNKAILGQGYGMSAKSLDDFPHPALAKIKQKVIPVYSYQIDYNLGDSFPSEITFFIIDQQHLAKFDKVVEESMNFKATSGGKSIKELLLEPGNAIMSDSLQKALGLEVGQAFQHSMTVFCQGDDNNSNNLTKIQLQNVVVMAMKEFSVFSELPSVSEYWVITSSFISSCQNYTFPINSYLFIVDNMSEQEMMTFERITQIDLVTREDVATFLSSHFYNAAIYLNFMSVIYLGVALHYVIGLMVLNLAHSDFFNDFKRFWIMRGGHSRVAFWKNVHFLMWYNSLRIKSLALAWILSISVLLANQVFIPLDQLGKNVAYFQLLPQLTIVMLLIGSFSIGLLIKGRDDLS